MKHQAFNPFLPAWEYIPDGEPHVFDGRVWLYGSHDRWNGGSFCPGDYVGWSAPVDDLAYWRYEGVLYRRGQDPENPGGKYPLYAPDVCRGPDGRYYLFYAPEGASVLGVAAADSPAGPFAFYGHVACPDGHLLGRQRGDPIPFDPGVFVEEDGRVFLYCGFAPKRPETGAVAHTGGPFVMELAPDMTTVAGAPEPVVLTGVPSCAEEGRGHGFFEASSLRKIRGRYYFIYSSQNSHELCYAVGGSPTGPFDYGGVLHSNGDIGLKGQAEASNYHGNNHGSLVEVQGRWYVFGHRMTGGTMFSRQGVAEEVALRPDGSIGQAEMTSCGLNGGPLAGLGTYEARIACVLRSGQGALRVSDPAFLKDKDRHPAFWQEGPDVDPPVADPPPRQYIANLREGAVAGFKYFRPAGAKAIRAVTRGSGGIMRVRTAPDALPSAQITLAPGGTWHESAPAPFQSPDGVFPLYFEVQADGAVDFLEFTLG